MLKETLLKIFIYLFIFMWIIFKVFIEFVAVLLLFYVFWFSGHETCGILALGPGIKLTLLPLEGKVLTTGPPGMSQRRLLL